MAAVMLIGTVLTKISLGKLICNNAEAQRRASLCAGACEEFLPSTKMTPMCDFYDSIDAL